MASLTENGEVGGQPTFSTERVQIHYTNQNLGTDRLLIGLNTLSHRHPYVWIECEDPDVRCELLVVIAHAIL